MLTRLASAALALVAMSGLANAGRSPSCPMQRRHYFPHAFGQRRVHLHAGRRVVGLRADRRRPELSCDRAEPTYLRFTLSASGPTSVIGNVGDPSCCGGTNSFAYGSTWSLPPFSCTSATTGLVCKRGGSGFTISKAKIEAH